MNLLLETLKREDTVVGAWVNIIGYTEGVVKEGKRKDGGLKRAVDGRLQYVNVQAIMLWSAGGVKIGEYETALTGRLQLSTAGHDEN